jgi:hypothetical protein
VWATGSVPVTHRDRVPIRVRLTLAFTAAMAVVVAASGLVLYLRLEGTLDHSIDQSLQAQLAEATALTR